jgi:hypothetical protein
MKDMDDAERLRFEAAVKAFMGVPPNFERHPLHADQYRDRTVDSYWCGWKLARETEAPVVAVDAADSPIMAAYASDVAEESEDAEIEPIDGDAATAGRLDGMLEAIAECLDMIAGMKVENESYGFDRGFNLALNQLENDLTGWAQALQQGDESEN